MGIPLSMCVSSGTLLVQPSHFESQGVLSDFAKVLGPRVRSPFVNVDCDKKNMDSTVCCSS